MERLQRLGCLHSSVHLQRRFLTRRVNYILLQTGTSEIGLPDSFGLFVVAKLEIEGLLGRMEHLSNRHICGQ
jgi:hypothetical protein